MKSRNVLLACLAILCASCAGSPRPRQAALAPFRPDPARIRAAFGVAPGAAPDQKAVNSAAQAIWLLCRGAHPVRDDLDIVFDRNKDGRIEADEVQLGRSYFYGQSLLVLDSVDPVLAASLAAPPRQSLALEDVRLWDSFLFSDTQARAKARRQAALEQKAMAEDQLELDGKIVKNPVALISRGAAEAFFRQAPAQAAKPFVVDRGEVRTRLQEYANTSGSGAVSEAEARAAEEALKAPHPVKSAFDKAVDFEGTGNVSAADIAEAKRAAFLPAARALAPAVGPFPVMTKADSLLDLNGDGIVTEDELGAVAQALLFGGDASIVPAKILAAFDANGDGKLDQREAQRALDYFRPHPLNPANALDLALDAQKAQFLTPEMIGIGAGSTAKGSTPSLDERVMALRLSGAKRQAVAAAQGQAPAASASPPPAPRKRLDIAGKKLAVMGVSSATKNVDQESLDGAAAFLENAFVNVGSVVIVDRSDIDKVMQEIQLQSSDAFSSEEQAVKAGKLSGAEILAAGTISLVGKKYYLNVKLLAVESGEVLGSSIASADSPDGFLAMCQEAAVKLF